MFIHSTCAPYFLCTFIRYFLIFGLGQFTLPQCLGVSGLCNPKLQQFSFPRIQTLYIMIDEHVHPIFCAHLIIYLGVFNLNISMSTPPLECYTLCVICNSYRYHFFTFKLSIMIVRTLKMCTGDAGPDRVWSCRISKLESSFCFLIAISASLVLFYLQIHNRESTEYINFCQ